MRAYTVKEIDEMRETIRWYGFPNGNYRPAERSAEIEDRIRTYMSGGVEPSDLKSELRNAHDERMKRGMVVVGTETIDGKEWTVHANGQRSWMGGFSRESVK